MANQTNIFIDSQTARCLLCTDAKCTKSCSKGVPIDGIIRSLRFQNKEGASRRIRDASACKGCKERTCELACIRGKIDFPLPIPEIMEAAAALDKGSDKKADLSTLICDVKFENPFLLSSSVVSSNYEMVAKAFEMGWAGVAFKTIGMFVPDEVSPRFDHLEREGEPFVGFKNLEQISDHPLDENLEIFRRLKKNYPAKILIASIMGQNEEEWEELARLCEEAGADIIECNFSCPQMVGDGLGCDVGIDPQLVASYTAAAKRGTKLPVLAKMTPNITNMEVPAVAAVNAGADGLAAINTIKSIMNVDLESFGAGPQVLGKTSIGGYSGKAVKPIALRFIHDMKKVPLLKDVPISGMGGIENWIDAAEFIALGCSTVQVTTSVMQYGYRIIYDLIDGLSSYMVTHNIEHISDFEGKALENIVPADDLDRSSICYPKFDRKACVGCGRCELSCYDGGHQALSMNDEGRPAMDAKKCVGCHLCALVCPAGAISAGTRVPKKK